jgi:hypothetical protein
MPEFITHQAELFIQMVLGAIGAGVRVAIGYDKQERQSKARIGATFVAGTVLAGTASHAITEYIGLSPAFSGSVSFMIGLLGIGFVYQVLEGKIGLPLIGKIKK